MRLACFSARRTAVRRPVGKGRRRRGDAGRRKTERFLTSVENGRGPAAVPASGRDPHAALPAGSRSARGRRPEQGGLRPVERRVPRRTAVPVGRHPACARPTTARGRQRGGGRAAPVPGRRPRLAPSPRVPAPVPDDAHARHLLAVPVSRGQPAVSSVHRGKCLCKRGPVQSGLFR